MSSERRALLRFEIPLASVGASLITLAFVFARSGVPAWLPRAPLARLGIGNPLTGMTRSFVAMAEGKLGTAMTWNPLGPFIFLVCCLVPLIALVGLITGRRLRIRALTGRRVWIGFAVLVVLVWVRQAMVIPV